MKTRKTIRTSLSQRGAKVFRVWYKHRSVAKTTVRPRLGNAVNGDGGGDDDEAEDDEDDEDNDEENDGESDDDIFVAIPRGHLACCPFLFLRF